MVDQPTAQPEVKRDQEAFPPALPPDPEGLDQESKNFIKSNILLIGAVIVIFIIVVLVVTL